MKKTLVAILALQGVVHADTSWAFDGTLTSTGNKQITAVAKGGTATYVDSGLTVGSSIGDYTLTKDLGKAIDLTQAGLYLALPDVYYTAGAGKLAIGGTNDTSFTIMGYVKYSTLTGEQYFFGTGANNTGGLGFGVANGNLNLVAKNVGNNPLTASNDTYTLSTDQWYHLAVSYDNSTNTATFYVNGDSVGSKAVTTVSTTPNGHGAAIGSSCQDLVNNAVRDDFNGYIADLSVYNSALNQKEIMKFAGLVPEPSTATLSLLALAGLAARRRRR